MSIDGVPASNYINANFVDVSVFYKYVSCM